MTRFLVPLGMLSISLGLLALLAGARGYPLLLIAAGGIVLAVSCFHRGGGSPALRPPEVPGTVEFSMPPVGSCPPERLRDARALAARVVESSATTGAHGRQRQ